MDSLSASGSVGDAGGKQFRRCTVSTANGVTKTQVYYPRPRSYSAGSQNVIMTSSKRLSAPLSATSAMKIVHINGTSSKMYGKTKSLEDGRKPLPSPTACGIMRYKTELCRPFLDNGFCKYGDKCQFAHGEQDLRNLPRHPKYKTELCRTFHTRGFCPYGSRCHFIHCVDETRNNLETSGAPKSPTKRTFSFSMPLSPSLDSGISSPDDFQRGRFFEFPVTDHSSGSGSDGDFDHSLDLDTGCVPHYNGQEYFTSPDPFQELDVNSLSSDSPTKPLTDDFSPDVCRMQELISQMQLEESPSLVSQDTSMRASSCHRLPVFDDMLNTKSDSALLDVSQGHSIKPFSF